MITAEEALKAIAFHFEVTGLAAAHIAVHQLYRDMVHGDAEHEVPTAEQVAAFGQILTDDKISNEQALDWYVEGKTKQEQECIELFLRHLQTFDIHTFKEGVLVGMLSAWMMCGAISTRTMEELDSLRENRGWQLDSPSCMQE